MESVYVVRLRGGTDLLLLAEIGLDEGDNVTFDMDGRQATFPRARFAEPAREIDFDSAELADAQRAAYAAYWARRELAANQQNETNQLLTYAKRHPFRQGVERRGGGFLRKDTYALGQLTEMLHAWLERAVDEDVVGEIGGFGRAVWLRSFVPEVDTEVPIPFGVHADTRAWGVARFLAFVSRCGGADHVRARRNDGETVLVSGDGEQTFSTVPYFYWSPSH
jgi:hypothetical protein